MPDSRHKVESLHPSQVRRVRVMLRALRWLHHALLYHDFEFRPRQCESVRGEAAWFGVDAGSRHRADMVLHTIP